MNILIIQGHPDPTGAHLCHALADAYRRGAEAAGHRVEVIDVGAADVGFVRSYEDFSGGGELPDYVLNAQSQIEQVRHVVLVFPLWLGGMPARLKAWLEQVFRNNFAMQVSDRGWTRHLRGKSARLIVTMAMPALFYRIYFKAHGTAMLRRSILGFCGISPIRQTLIGGVGSRSRVSLGRELAKVERFGREGAVSVQPKEAPVPASGREMAP